MYSKKQRTHKKNKLKRAVTPLPVAGKGNGPLWTVGSSGHGVWQVIILQPHRRLHETPAVGDGQPTRPRHGLRPSAEHLAQLDEVVVGSS